MSLLNIGSGNLVLQPRDIILKQHLNHRTWFTHTTSIFSQVAPY